MHQEVSHSQVMFACDCGHDHPFCQHGIAIFPVTGGGYGPDRLLAASPGKRPREPVKICLATFRCLCVCGCVCFSLRSLCIMYTKRVCFRQRPAKSRAQNLQGRSFLFAFVSFCCLGAPIFCFEIEVFWLVLLAFVLLGHLGSL